MSKINILVVPSDNQGGVGFYRSTQPHIMLEHMFPEEFNVTFNMKPEWLDLKSFDKYDIIHVHKGLYENETAFRNAIEYCKSKGIVTVLDLDDHWKLDYRHPMFKLNSHFKIDQTIIENIRLFDWVTTTTPIFEKEIRKYNKNTISLYNAIDPTDERFIVNKPKSNRLRIGLIMGSSHEHDMNLIGKITNQLTDEEKSKVQFVLCGFDTRGSVQEIDPRTKQIKPRPIRPEETVWYRYEKELTCDYSIIDKSYEEFLKKFLVNVSYPLENNSIYRRCWTKDMNHYYEHYSNVDVLLVPLCESDFNKVKSPLKVVECAFSHTAIVASDFGPYSIDLKNAFEKGGTINKDGNALLVDPRKNNKHWLKFIKMLINNPDLVKQLQDNLYNDVHEKYDLRNVTKDRADFYKRITTKE